MPVISFGLELSCELQEPKESLSVRKPPPVLYEETALVASRYIEGHALTLCIYTVTVTKQHARLLVNSN